jgi:8-oxo-dGTP diphosphatase
MTEYKNPKPTVDIIIEIQSDNMTKIVIIKRKNEPFGYALPGGFVDDGESLITAAIREALEETCLHIQPYMQFFTYSNPVRDPRQHTISTVFLAKAVGHPVGGDDAAEAILIDPEKIASLVFDHGQIVNDYLVFKKSGKLPPWDR